VPEDRSGGKKGGFVAEQARGAQAHADGFCEH
jgi:hypothetical protein